MSLSVPGASFVTLACEGITDPTAAYAAEAETASEMAQEPADSMPQALPPSLAALLARDDFVDAVFEGGRCAHSVGEAPGTIFELVLDRLLAALDGESTVSPSGGYGFPARAASYHQGLDFQLGRVNEKGGWDRFDPVQKSKFHGALTSMACTRRTG